MVTIVANPYHRTETQTEHAVRMIDILNADEDAHKLESRAIADDAWLPVAMSYAAQLGFATGLDELMHDFLSVGLPQLAAYVVEFAATRGIELEVK